MLAHEKMKHDGLQTLGLQWRAAAESDAIKDLTVIKSAVFLSLGTW